MNTFEKIEVVSWSLPDTDIKIERRTNKDGAHKWVVCRHGCVLAKDLGLEYEPIPSSRDEAFIERTRYKSVQEACEYIDKALTETLI